MSVLKKHGICFESSILEAERAAVFGVPPGDSPVWPRTRR